MKRSGMEYILRCLADAHSSFDVTKVPDLGERCPFRAAPEVWNNASLGFEGILDLGQWVGGFVRGSNAVGSQQIVSGVFLETAEVQ